MTEPYAHVGVADVHEEERPGLTCDDCLDYSASKMRALDENYQREWSGVSFASVPGGSSGARRGGLTPAQRERMFNKDMDAYSEARKNGLKPERTNKKAVEKAEQKQEGLDRVRKMVTDGKVMIENG